MSGDGKRATSARADEEEITDLETLLDRLTSAREEAGDKLPVGDLLERVGGRSTGVLLLIPGLLMVSPLSGIPGLPSAVAVAVVIVAAQMALGKDHFSLPGWVERRTIPGERFDKALRFLRPGARFIDRLLRPRLCALTSGVASRLIAALAILIGIAMVPLDLVPFANTTAGLALSSLGLALVARDGVLLLLGLAFCAGVAGLATKLIL